MKKYTCPSCGYKTFDEEPGNYEICPICFWEDNLVQSKHIDYSGGTNKVSLRQAQQNFLKFGACEERFVDKVRKPTTEDVKDTNWTVIDFQK